MQLCSGCFAPLSSGGGGLSQQQQQPAADRRRQQLQALPPSHPTVLAAVADESAVFHVAPTDGGTKTALLFSTVYVQNDRFTKTGSGQT